MYILIVNKDEKETIKIQDFLNKTYHNINYLIAKNVLEANKIVKNKQVKIAFVELENKKLLDLAKTVIDKSKEVNIIFMSKTKEYCYEAFEIHASGYILKPLTEDNLKEAIKHLRYNIKQDTKKRIKANCFGTFEIYADDKNIKFGRSKAKEFLAYLIDRKGLLCGNTELLQVLFPNEEPTDNLRQQVRNIFYDLNNSLKNVDAADIIEKNGNLIGIDKSKIDCDYYKYLENDQEALNSYKGEYMSQYANWSNITKDELDNNK